MKKYEWICAKSIYIPSVKNVIEAWWENYWRRLKEIRNLKEK